jgi:hypothetical protein
MNGDAWLGDIGGGEWSMGDLEGGGGFWGGGASELPTLSDAEIVALRDSGLTTDTSYTWGGPSGPSSSFDWGGLFKSALGVVGGVASTVLNRPPQLQYGANAPGSGYSFFGFGSRPGLGATGGAPILGPGGVGGLFSSPLVWLAAIAGFVLLMMVSRRG